MTEPSNRHAEMAKMMLTNIKHCNVIGLEVEDAKGEVIASARDAAKLHEQLDEREKATSQKRGSQSDAIWKKARTQYERPIESFDALKQTHSKHLSSFEIGQDKGLPIFAHPALRKSGNDLRIHLFNSEADARASNRIGIAALIEFELRYPLAWIRKDLKVIKKIGPTLVAFGKIEALLEDSFVRIQSELCRHEIETLDLGDIESAATQAQEKAKGFLYKLTDAIKAVLERRQNLIVRKELFPDLLEHIDRLVPSDFIRQTPFWALQRIPLYLKLIEKRQKIRPQNPERDASREKEVEAFRSQYSQLAAPHQTSAEGQTLKWTIEEFSISIHAQELGTAFPVSAKRLKAQFAKRGTGDRAQISGVSKAKPSPATAKPSSPAKPIDRPTSADLQSLKNLFG
jgi:ATP-dependent helicase HrpA